MGESSRQQSETRGRTDTAGRIELRQLHSIGGKGINVRRLDLAAVASDIADTLVVREQQQHVGAGRSVRTRIVRSSQRWRDDQCYPEKI